MEPKNKYVISRPKSLICAKYRNQNFAIPHRNEGSKEEDSPVLSLPVPCPNSPPPRGESTRLRRRCLSKCWPCVSLPMHWKGEGKEQRAPSSLLSFMVNTNAHVDSEWMCTCMRQYDFLLQGWEQGWENDFTKKRHLGLNAWISRLMLSFNMSL